MPTGSMEKTKEELEFDRLRKYILACSEVPKDSIAIQAALQGMDTELKRMERDAKLKRKFNASVNRNTTTTAEKGIVVSTATTANDKKNSSIVKMKTEDRSSSASLSGSMKANNDKNSNEENNNNDNDDLMMDDEWHDIATNTAGSLGNRLAQLAIASMAHYKTEVKSPLAAIALALHASLVTDALRFKCTGVPESTSQQSSGGFAPPIRELPKTQFLPPTWDTQSKNEILLRYRKTGVGSVVLRVLLDDDSNQVVQTSLTRSHEPEPLVFPLADHVNLESFQKAIQNQGNSLSASVPPALHYKALPVLLTNFCNTFDLGSIYEEDSSVTPPDRLPYVDTTVVVPPPSSSVDPLRISRPVQQNHRDHHHPYNMDPHATPTIRVFQPNPHRGDFAGDLVPPGYGNYMGDRGMLMGPNHPLFAGRDGTGYPTPPGGMVPGQQGFGMRPRFDPYGPPGGPQEDPNNANINGGPNPGRFKRPPPGGFGEPNNDHARPPNDLGNNMFM